MRSFLLSRRIVSLIRLLVFLIRISSGRLHVIRVICGRGRVVWSWVLSVITLGRVVCILLRLVRLAWLLVIGRLDLLRLVRELLGAVVRAGWVFVEGDPVPPFAQLAFLCCWVGRICRHVLHRVWSYGLVWRGAGRVHTDGDNFLILHSCHQSSCSQFIYGYVCLMSGDPRIKREFCGTEKHALLAL